MGSLQKSSNALYVYVYIFYTHTSAYTYIHTHIHRIMVLKGEHAPYPKHKHYNLPVNQLSNIFIIRFTSLYMFMAVQTAVG